VPNCMGGAGVGPGCMGGACMKGDYTAVACGCAGDAGPAAMTFVGSGEGDFVTETGYKYVGAGNGNLSMVAPKKVFWGRILGVTGGLLVLLLVLAVSLRPRATTTTTIPLPTTAMPTQQPAPITSPPPPPSVGDCTFWGDPHMKTFDGARPSYYGDGEVWIVKSKEVKIQGRFEGTVYTKGLAATNAVAVSGPFIQNHVIKVFTIESGEGITVDGQPVLQSLGSTYGFVAGTTLTYNDQGELPDAAAGIWKKRVVHMKLPMGVELTVFRWNNYLDLRLRMPALPDQDGACGNFNGNAADDTNIQVQTRKAAVVGPGELLFQSRKAVQFTPAEKALLEMCERNPQLYKTALQKCQTNIGGRLHMLHQHKACMLNMCMGQNEHALRYAKAMGL